MLIYEGSEFVIKTNLIGSMIPPPRMDFVSFTDVKMLSGATIHKL
jgi:hypothetical protein